jgi:hypothetical protein
MADDKDKQKYSYRPNIEYQDTYESGHENKSYDSIAPTKEEQNLVQDSVIDNINNSFNDVTKIIPLMPAQLQTSINGVFKPVLDSWASMNNTTYPSTIPDSEIPEYVRPEDERDVEPIDPEYIYPVPPDPYIPRPNDDEDEDFVIDNEGTWDPDIPMFIKFTEVDPVEIIEKEYIKNVADLFDYYTNRLKNILYHYYSEKIKAMYSKKLNNEGKYVNKTKSEIAFLFEPLTDSCKNVDADSKHLYDASVSMSEHAMLKLHFLENAFPLDQTMFLLKNFNAVYQLRLRYAKIDTADGSNKINAMSNNILRGMKASYDQKYDVAFMNLYKYLNSSLDILEDVTNTELAGLKARSTLIEKGGIKK